MQMKSLVKSLGATPSAIGIAGALVLVVPVLPAQANDTVQLSAAARGRILNKADSQINAGTQTENVNSAWDQIASPNWDQIASPSWDQIASPSWDQITGPAWDQIMTRRGDTTLSPATNPKDVFRRHRRR
jgi:hypothetical protein